MKQVLGTNKSNSVHQTIFVKLWLNPALITAKYIQERGMQVRITTKEELQTILPQVIDNTPIVDLHTHLYGKSFGKLLLWGIDDLLTYHYLTAEYFRYSDLPYQDFFALPKRKQADEIWNTLFLQRSPISEAQRGVLTVLRTLGLDLTSRNLDEYREFFAQITIEDFIDQVFTAANIESVVMTNDPFDQLEQQVWNKGMGNQDPRFKASLRLDVLLENYLQVIPVLQKWGYRVTKHLDETTLREIRRFLEHWIDKINALYVGASFPPSFSLPEDSIRGRLIEECVIPVCRTKNIPFALMIGVKRQVNSHLNLAADSVGKTDIRPVEYMCRAYPDNKFMVTTLDRGSQHELAVTARKFPNLMVFGCWWFLNNPSLIQEITLMRTELLGWAYIPQHSDARVLDQLIYKWEHSRQILTAVLTSKYGDLLAAGWSLERSVIERDVRQLLRDNFLHFVQR